MEVGQKAPDFILTDQKREPVHFADRIGKKIIVLYFYPKDFTGGCTKEACGFRDSYTTFSDAGAEVIGVSADDPATHERFIQEYKLPFTLLSDPDHKVADSYGIGKMMGIFPGRVTFVIDRDGIVRDVFESNTNMDAHIDEAKKVVLQLDKQSVK